VAGRGNTSRSLERNAELQLRLDKRSYATGDEIAISVRAPYTGAGLITIERDKVYTQQWFKADSTNSVQHIRVPAGLEGNAYVNVQFVRDIGSSEVYMSPLSYGVVPFSINLDARRMPLKVDGPAQIEPGQTLDIKVNAEPPGPCGGVCGGRRHPAGGALPDARPAGLLLPETCAGSRHQSDS